MTKPSAEFNLVDQWGQPADSTRFHGALAWYFFGFTHCGMVCPRALGRMSTVLEQLGRRSEAIQAIYVTVDPERDSPEVLNRFLSDDYPRFIGLTGTREQIDAAKAAFHVFSRRAADPNDPDGYQMPHSAFSYLIDKNGRYLTHFTDAQDVDDLAARLASYL